jgi:hypothetical protein
MSKIGSILVAVMAFRQEPNRLLARWLENKCWRYPKLRSSKNSGRFFAGESGVAAMGRGVCGEKSM